MLPQHTVFGVCTLLLPGRQHGLTAELLLKNFPGLDDISPPSPWKNVTKECDFFRKTVAV
jgi:hypothetical protein